MTTAAVEQFYLETKQLEDPYVSSLETQTLPCTPATATAATAVALVAVIIAAFCLPPPLSLTPVPAPVPASPAPVPVSVGGRRSTVTPLLLALAALAG